MCCFKPVTICCSICYLVWDRPQCWLPFLLPRTVDKNGRVLREKSYPKQLLLFAESSRAVFEEIFLGNQRTVKGSSLPLTWSNAVLWETGSPFGALGIFLSCLLRSGLDQA